MSGSPKATPGKGVSRSRLRRGHRAGRVREGNLRNLGGPNDADTERYDRAKENGAKSEVVGESERCTVPEKRGNLTEGTPWRESGAGVRTR